MATITDAADVGAQRGLGRGGVGGRGPDLGAEGSKATGGVGRGVDNTPVSQFNLDRGYHLLPIMPIELLPVHCSVY